jgi:transposase
MKKKSGFPILYPNAAGIDVASKEHFVAVNPEIDDQPVRSFGAFTEDLLSVASWLTECKVDTVAMEATGIYWVSLYLILEEAGFNVVLVNAKHVKNVTGKKSDVKDAEWIRQLHSCGLLSASFQPDEFTRKLRCFMRHRKNLTEMAATHIRMMQKAMEQMNIKLQHVITDITGKTGQAIIKAILEGERNPKRLILLVDGRIRAPHQEIIKSLEGIWKEEHLFALQQSFDLFHIYRQKINACDHQIKAHLKEKEASIQLPLKSEGGELIKTKTKTNKNNLSFDATEMLTNITGVDLTKIFGLTDTNALELISEVGLNMHKWPTVKNFTSWLNLAPNTKISGGKTLSSRTAKRKNKAGQIFKFAAFAVQRSKNWLAIFYHRIKSRSGTGKAITATARKIAVIFYSMLKNRTDFNAISMDAYSENFRELQLKKIQKQAKRLGFKMVPESVT